MLASCRCARAASRLPGGKLVDAEVGQRDGEPVVVSGRPGQGEGFLVVSESGVQVAGFALEHGATAEKVSDQPGISGCPGQRDGFVDLSPCGGQIALLEPEPAQLGQGVGGDGVIGEAAGDPRAPRRPATGSPSRRRSG